MSDWTQRAQLIRDKFCRFGECADPLPQSEPTLKSGLGCPEPLLALFSTSSSWHIMKDHCGVFGFNLFEKGAFLNREQIFGDAECMEEWKKEHSSPNCAEEGWECIAAVSEYDYIFVCLKKDSPHFGSTRVIVNNCFEDEPLIESFEEFFEKIEGFAEERIKQRVGFSKEEKKDEEEDEDEEEEDEDEMELLEFLDFVNP